MTFKMTALPCPCCLNLAREGKIRSETIQPLPEGALAPLGLSGQKICFDCAAAGTLLRLGLASTFEAARIAVGNDRQEQYRLPGVKMGLVKIGIVRPSKEGDLERHYAWLEENQYFGLQSP